jgi:hypothetical protein
MNEATEQSRQKAQRHVASAVSQAVEILAGLNQTLQSLQVPGNAVCPIPVSEIRHLIVDANAHVREYNEALKAA